jgi:hypothetical protein
LETYLQAQFGNFSKTRKIILSKFFVQFAGDEKNTSETNSKSSCSASLRPGHILGPCPNGSEAKGWCFGRSWSLSHRSGTKLIAFSKYSSLMDVTELNADTNVYKNRGYLINFLFFRI